MAELISSTSRGLTRIEFDSSKISSLKAPIDDTTGTPIAKDSIIALLQPSFRVGSTNKSEAA